MDSDIVRDISLFWEAYWVFGSLGNRDNVNIRNVDIEIFLCLGSGIPFSQGFFIRDMSRGVKPSRV